MEKLHLLINSTVGCHRIKQLLDNKENINMMWGVVKKLQSIAN
jgi:hypothetical protein